jgi:signal transduction histidine kinase
MPSRFVTDKLLNVMKARSSRAGWLPDAITTTGGLLCVVIGAAMMVAWLVRATAVLRFGGHDPMTFNTALALTVTGGALAGRRPRAAMVAGVLDAAFGLALLAEYALGRSLGIDQLVVKAYIRGPGNIPGRPAANTAVCFLLVGVALLAWRPWHPRPRPIVLAVAGSLIGAIAVTATFGYVTGTPTAYRWGHLAGMAFVTAGAMLILALALLSAAWRDASTGREGLPKWLPLPAGVLALCLAAIVWLAVVGAGRITVGTSVGAATALGFLMAGLVALVVWLAQHADLRRRVAVTEAARLAEAETEIQALNATLEQQVRHLEVANKSLGAFSYSIAHDLRTPLRAMSGFAEILSEEYSDRLDEAGRGYAGRIQAASTHMSGLIDDLLDMSRVSEAEIRLQEVDLSADVTAICDQLRARDPGRRVRVTVEDGVRVTADAVLIRTVLENLLENAWKFTARRDDASIEFGTVSAGDAGICCYVRDNGAGFDPAYASKLFQQFQRLHAATEFPGTGIGLATVRRIIERHRGRVWAEGTIDRGATFYFALDANDTMNDSPILAREPIPSPPG